MRQEAFTKSSAGSDRCLDTAALVRLEQSFRNWIGATPRRDVRLARQRVLLIFLLIRYTGARLNEVLALDPWTDIDCERRTVRFGGPGPDNERVSRQVQISEPLASEIREILADPAFQEATGSRFGVDPAFVRRKFYERAAACGFEKRLGGPELVRRARAVELMQAKMPLAAMQKMLGAAMPHNRAARISFSPDEIEELTRRFVEREATRRTSARNTFFGKIVTIRRGDIQARVTLLTVSGQKIATVITNDSLHRLDLAEGRLMAAEIKAPWVMLYRGEKEPACSAENRFSGIVERVVRGKVNTEYGVGIADGTELCAVISSESGRRLALKRGDRVWAVFNAFAVVLHAD
ncbi:MAG: TOBE domain-containing protein [Desulfobacteraceae bacterium]|jgi:molybdate transport system regulatory protein|nr:TOBE domain-containing protein [Desulfobacteraceae bacterium]